MPWYKTLPFLMVTALAIMLGLALITLVPLSKYCKPESSEKAKVSAEYPADKEAISDQESPFVKVVKALFQAQKAEYESRDTKTKGRDWIDGFLCDMKATDFLLAMFTLALVIVGTWQGIHLKRTVDAAVATDRPRLHLSTLRFSRAGGNIKDVTKMPIITVGLKNHGGSVALVTRAFVAMKVIGELPKTPEYGNGVYVPTGKTVGVGDEYVLPEQWFVDFGEYMPGPIEAFPFKAHFWVYGRIEYQDQLDMPHAFGFVGFWMPPDTANPSGDASGQSFMIASIKNYSYNT